MTDLSSYQNFYLMGIKGVAMTSIAQILLDANKNVRGCDVEEKFVTQPLLEKFNLKIDYGFDHQLPEKAEVVIYTSAHGGPDNKIVKQAQEKGIPTISQAEALAYFFNQKQGIAVCGVGGKSTVSAMITWMLEKTGRQPSYSVGVGEILGLARTGQWQDNSQHFIAEADEYVVNPACHDQQEKMIPRFSFLKPKITICTNLEFDHPDVYQDFNHTKQVFLEFLLQTQRGGVVVYNQDNQDLADLISSSRVQFKQKNIKLLSYGQQQKADLQLVSSVCRNQSNQGVISFKQQKYQLNLAVPGKFNLMNALAAMLAANQIEVGLEESLTVLASFNSTKRRFELVGVKDGVTYYDDYAHHPHEIRKTIAALKKWHPDVRRVIAFQPHTFSRTKKLLTDFVEALGTAEEVVLLDIFSSAREKYDPSITSDLLVKQVKQNYPETKIANLKTIKSLADFCHNQLNKGGVLITMGAGDIYQVYEQLEIS